MSTEVADLLQRLIRLDTTNPPGNETAAAELLRDYLEAAGVECELYARVPERANLVARIRGTRRRADARASLAHRRRARRREASGNATRSAASSSAGEVWGRGALDMKGEVAASAVALATLAREGWRGAGDLIFVAAADEEVGDGFGLQWLVEEHPDAVRADYSSTRARATASSSAARCCTSARRPRR